ncbi:macro domain-containing protein [Proteiniclasticum sp.]|uniref:macro domain-containing protein n=1 Tax=Proteiniclasticum sp. TaxID=2053595 RepID=UPI0028A27651|nr:macro domain-containing protein [Proteiniclasticum sp.]
MPFHIVRGDITVMDVDAVVNAANTSLSMGGGVCGAIFLAAGPRELQKECDEIMQCPVGQAVITDGYQLKARKIIHAVGPIWQGGGNHEEELLRSAYVSALKLAREEDLESIAFPLISSGVYGYPKDEAQKVAVEAITGFLQDEDLTVYLVIYDHNYFKISEEKRSALKEYIRKYHQEENRRGRKLSDNLMNLERLEIPVLSVDESPQYMKHSSLEDILAKLDEPFTKTLFRHIDEKGLDEVEVYKKANIDRKLFSKIRSDINYKPSKPTAIAFAIALELNLDETLDLLARAGFTLSHASKFDLIVEYHIKVNRYDIHEINSALFDLCEKTLA